MRLKDILESTFFKTKIEIIITFPFDSSKKQYTLTDCASGKKELLTSEKVAPFLDREVQFVDASLRHDMENETFFTTLDIFVYGK